MSVCRARSLSLFGIDALPVEVEVDGSSGLPGFSIVGLPDAAVQEARYAGDAAAEVVGGGEEVGGGAVVVLDEDEREADRDDEEAHDPGAPLPDRAPEAELERDPEERRHHHCEERSEDQALAPGHVHDERHVRAEDEVLAVGEVDDLEDPVDEREADRRDRDDRSGHEAVRNELEKLVQQSVVPAGERPCEGKRRRMGIER